MNESDIMSGKMIEPSQLSLSMEQCGRETLGVLNQEFLMQSIGGLAKKLPVCIDQNTDVQSAVREMIDRKAGSALLIDESQKVVGIFTERDYLKHCALDQKDPASTTLREIATLDPVTVTPHTTLAHALNLMSLGGFRHLPIVDDLGQAVGIVSVRDVIDKIADLLVRDLMSFGEDA